MDPYRVEKNAGLLGVVALVIMLNLILTPRVVPLHPMALPLWLAWVFMSTVLAAVFAVTNWVD